MKKIAICSTFLILGCSPQLASSNHANTVKPQNSSSCDDVFQNYKPDNLQVVIKKLSKLVIKKDDFETNDAYMNRLINQLKKDGIDPERTYYFTTPLDPDYVKYNADNNQLIVEEYAISNNAADPLILFGYGSYLQKNGINVDHGLFGKQLTLKTNSKNVGSYIGHNAFGVKAQVFQNKFNHYGIYDKEISYDEFFKNDKTAFSLNLPPEQAKDIKNRGFAVIATRLKYPYFAKGNKEYEATVSAPLNNQYQFNYLIGNLDCAAIGSSKMGIISAKPIN